MPTLTFYARGDSTSANNASLNAMGTNKVPTTELVFSSGTSGDLLLEYANGGFDPDTTVFVDGVERSFVVEFSGNLPSTNKLSNVNGEDLRGEEIIVITTDDGTRYFFLSNGTTSFATMDDFPNGAHPIQNVDNVNDVVICFARGSMIGTPVGEVPVESLKAGDVVITADGRTTRVAWVTKRAFDFMDLLFEPAYRPVTIPKGFLGTGYPHSDLTVSALHRIVVSSWVSELLFCEPEVMVAAKHLMQSAQSARVNLGDGVEYFHLMLDRHDVLIANGLPSESMFPGDQAIASLSEKSRRELECRFRNVHSDWSQYGPTARRVLTGYEAKLLIAYGGMKELSPGAVSQPEMLLAA